MVCVFMSGITVNLLRFHVDLPQELALMTSEALSAARESEQRLSCALHMTKAVACALFNGILYFGDAVIRGVYIGCSESGQRGWEHFLQQVDNSLSTLKCSAFILCLLFKSIFAEAAAVRPNIIIQNHLEVPRNPEPLQGSIQEEGLNPEPLQDSLQADMQAIEQMPVENSTPNPFQPWFQGLLTTLPQDLLSTLYPESSAESLPHPLQEPLRNWLQYQLQHQLPNMIRNIYQSPATKEFSQPFSPPEWAQDEAQFQGLLQNLLPDLLREKLLALFQGLSQQQLQERLQEPLQEQPQEQLSYLRQNLVTDAVLKEEQWQNELQNHLQSQFRDRLQGLRLAQLEGTLQGALRQELIERLGEDGFQLKRLPESIYALFYERLLKLPKCGRPDSSRPLESRLRTDLVADIFLDLFIDQFLEPLRNLTQNKCQDLLTENLCIESYTSIRQSLFRMIQQESAEQRSSEHYRCSPLPSIRDNLFQGLVDTTSLPPGLLVKEAHDLWVNSSGYQGMFQLWCQWLLADLSQGLATHLLSSNDYLDPLLSGLPADQLQGQLCEILRKYITEHLQHMIISILYYWEDKIFDRQSYTSFALLRQCKGDFKTEKEQIQKLLQETLSELLPNWLIKLPTKPLLLLLGQCHKRLNEAELQDTLKSQIQNRIPDLHQSLVRTVRQKLYQEPNLYEARRENELQNQLQDQLQNQLQSRLKKLHLGQLYYPLRTIGQELLCRDPFSLYLNDFSPWTRALCLNRIQPPSQGVFASLWNKLITLIHPSMDRGLPPDTLGDLFPHRHPNNRISALRADLLVDFLLDILLDLIEKALPEGFPGNILEPLPAWQLPNLCLTLKKIINEDMAPPNHRLHDLILSN